VSCPNRRQRGPRRVLAHRPSWRNCSNHCRKRRRTCERGALGSCVATRRCGRDSLSWLRTWPGGERERERQGEKSRRGPREDRKGYGEEEERKDCSVIFALSCFILTRTRPYWAVDPSAGACYHWSGSQPSHTRIRRPTALVSAFVLNILQSNPCRRKKKSLLCKQTRA